MRIYSVVVAMAALGLVACSPVAQQQPTATAAPPAASNTATTELSAPQTVGYNGPAWTTLPLTNAHSGETFRLADFAGKTVFLKPMAIW